MLYLEQGEIIASVLETLLAICSLTFKGLVFFSIVKILCLSPCDSRFNRQDYKLFFGQCFGHFWHKGLPDVLGWAFVFSWWSTIFRSLEISCHI